jgi:hypothetical protein
MHATALTISGNRARGGLKGLPNDFGSGDGPGTGGGVAASGGSATMRGSICAGNTRYGSGPGGRDASGTFTSGGFNLIGTTGSSSGLTLATDQGGSDLLLLDAMLGVLQDNGGSTDTMLPLAGSPALDRGHAFDLRTGQRCEARTWDDPALANAVEGDGSDTGAVEVSPPYNGPPYFISIANSGQAVYLLVQGVPGRSYKLQSNGDAGSSFVDVTAPVPTDSIGRVELVDPGPLVRRRFYRAMETP